MAVSIIKLGVLSLGVLPIRAVPCRLYLLGSLIFGNSHFTRESFLGKWRTAQLKSIAPLTEPSKHEQMVAWGPAPSCRRSCPGRVQWSSIRNPLRTFHSVRLGGLSLN